MPLTAESRLGALRVQLKTEDGVMTHEGPFALSVGQDELQMSAKELDALAIVGLNLHEKEYPYTYGCKVHHGLQFTFNKDSVRIVNSKKDLLIPALKPRDVSCLIFRFVRILKDAKTMDPKEKVGLFASLRDLVGGTDAPVLARALDFKERYGVLGLRDRDDECRDLHQLERFFEVLPVDVVSRILFPSK